MCVCNQIPIYWRNISTSERSEAIFVLPQPSARAKSRAANPRVLSEISIARRLGVWMIPRFGRIRMQAIGFAGMAVGMLMLLATVGLTNSRLHSPLVFVGFILFNLLMNAGSNSTTVYAGPNIVADTVAWDNWWIRRWRCQTRCDLGRFPPTNL